ncbi:hypothetical protein [Neobacillus vireti]|uniref:hypothetical protein n=1 Tax=Neobacillus vireti TaxID=220686 RepID=UPI0030002D14
MMKRIVKLLFPLLALACMGGATYGAYEFFTSKTVEGTITEAPEENQDKQEDPSSTEALLTDPEIRSVMEKYFEWVETSYTFLTERLQYDATLINIYNREYEEKISTLVSRNYMNEHKDFLETIIATSGEGMPHPNYDTRFEVMENTPTKVSVKSLVEPFIYGADYNEFADNFYITAVKENGQWLIDKVTLTSAPEEAVNFTEEEIKKLIQANGLTYLGDITLNATIGHDQSMNEIISETKVYLVEGEFTDGVDGLTAASGNVIYDIPADSVPTPETSENEEVTGPLVLEYAFHEDGTITASYKEGATISLKVGEEILIQRTDSMDENEFYDELMISSGPIDWNTAKQTTIIGVQPGISELNILPFDDWDQAYTINFQVTE